MITSDLAPYIPYFALDRTFESAILHRMVDSYHSYSHGTGSSPCLLPRKEHSGDGKSDNNDCQQHLHQMDLELVMRMEEGHF